jgi:hypothetical protein
MRVTVDTNVLLETVQANRDTHQRKFREAHDAYRAKVIRELSRALDRANSGGEIKTHFSLPVPEDHTTHYDRAIQMLGLHTADSIELSSEDYSRYVDDEWDWKSRFDAVSQVYAVTD